MTTASTGLQCRLSPYWAKRYTQEEMIIDLFRDNPGVQITVKRALDTIKECAGVEIKRGRNTKYGLGNWFRTTFRATGILIEHGKENEPAEWTDDERAVFSLNTESVYCINCWHYSSNDYSGNPRRERVYVWEKEEHLRKMHSFSDDNIKRYGIEAAYSKEEPPAKLKDHKWKIIAFTNNHEIELQCELCEKTHTEYISREDCGGQFYAKWQAKEDAITSAYDAKKEAAQQ